MHKPEICKHENTSTLVVFIHGFMGSPEQFRDLAQAVHDRGFSHISVLLPGHGGSWKDFSGAGLADWEEHLRKVLECHGPGYDRIYLAGHSMGGLLAVNESVLYGGNIRGVFMIAPPMKINYANPRSLLTRFWLLTRPKKHGAKRAYMDSNSISKPGFFSWIGLLKPAAQLHKLIRKTRGLLPRVSVPVVILYSKRDETASQKSAGILEKRLTGAPKKIIPLNKSLHAYYTPDEREIILREFLEFI